MKLLNNLNSWLDKKLLESDRKHFYLKYSNRKIERLIWNTLYKPDNFLRDYLTFKDQNSMELFNESDIDQASVRRHAEQVVHVVNYIDVNQIDNEDLKKRTSITLDSFKLASKKDVKLIACHESNMDVDDIWFSEKLSRSARSQLGAERDLAFLVDMLDIACKYCEDNDYIVYSNLDCPISPNIYKNLLDQNEDIIQYFIRDVKADTIGQVYSADYTIKQTGVDGFAIKKGVYLALKKYLPDLVIGEPHWDTVFWGIFKKFHYAKDNLSDLYHINHDRFWATDELSKSGKYNEMLYRDSFEYGIIDELLISLEKQHVLIIINDSNCHNRNKKIKNICRAYPDYELVFLDLIAQDMDVCKDLPEEVFYFPIHADESTSTIKQRIPIMNIGAHLFEDRKMLFFMDIVDQHIFKTISCNEYNKLGKFDNFIENETQKGIIYVNDEGLLAKL